MLTNLGDRSADSQTCDPTLNSAPSGTRLATYVTASSFRRVRARPCLASLLAQSVDVVVPNPGDVVGIRTLSVPTYTANRTAASRSCRRGRRTAHWSAPSAWWQPSPPPG